jgi:hypothetical protein
MMLNAAFNNISVISLRSVLLAEETGEPETHKTTETNVQGQMTVYMFSRSNETSMDNFITKSIISSVDQIVLKK